MLTRRLGLLASAFFLGAGPAFSQSKHAKQGAHKGKDGADTPTGSPADKWRG